MTIADLGPDVEAAAAAVLEQLVLHCHDEDWRTTVDPAKVALADALLRAFSLPATPTDPINRRRRPVVSEEVRWRVHKRDNYRCQGCGAETRLTIDHRRPVSRGGTDDEGNLQTLCRSCNSGKGARV